MRTAEKKRSKSPVGHDAIYRIGRNLPLPVQAIIGITNSPSKFFKVTVATPAKIKTNYSWFIVLFPGGRVLPIMAYIGRLRPLGGPFSGFWYTKGLGNLTFGSVKGPKRAIR